MEEKYKAVFSLLGINNVDFSDEKITPQNVANDVMIVAKRSVSNDAEFMNGIKKNILDNELSNLSKLVGSKYNLKENEYTGKTVEQVVEIGLLKKGNASEESILLQNQLAESRKENDYLKKEVIPGLDNKVKSELSAVRRKQKIGDVVRKIDLVVTDADDILDTVYSKLQSNYNMVFDENDEFSFTAKNSTLQVMDDSGYKPLSKDEIVKKELDKMGILKKTKDSANVPTPSPYLNNNIVPQPTNTNRAVTNTSAISKAQANLIKLTQPGK